MCTVCYTRDGSDVQNGTENTWYNYTQYNVLRLMKVMWSKIHISKFHQETLSSHKALTSLAHADWANGVDLQASFKSCNHEAFYTFKSLWVNDSDTSYFVEVVWCSKQ